MNDKKWVYGLVIGLVALLALGAGCCYKARSTWAANQARLYTGVNNPVWADLFQLNNSNLKLNTEQARAILPIVEQIKTADSTNSQELARQVYAQLNSQQYQALLAQGNARKKGNSRINHHRPMMNRTGLYGDGRDQSIRLAALPDLVVKQLQEIASGQSSANQAPAAVNQGQNQPSPKSGAQPGNSM